MIIIGYQGIGKSTLAEKDMRIIDLESSNFFIDGVRSNDWAKVYANIATHLSEQGYIVFVSSHQIVRYELSKKNEPIAVCYPALRLEYKWIDKLEKRFIDTKRNKDYKALVNAKMNYKENIEAIIKDSEKYNYTKFMINDIDYDLKEIIGLED